VSIEISDTGSGIAREDLDQVFDLFFTTKPPGQGTGLGLPLSRDIIEEIGGELAIESRERLGTTVRVLLPVTSADAP
jgi:signal transduction histidine kinase